MRWYLRRRGRTAPGGPSGPGEPGGPTALVLSGSIGQGHATVAEVCAKALERGRRTGDVAVVDCIGLLGPVSSRLAERIYRASISWPFLYDGFHFSHLRAEGRLAARGDRQAVDRILGALETRGLTRQVELGFAVFATGAPVAVRLARSRPGAKAVVFCTDATAHSKWAVEGVDLFIVTSDLAAASLRRYQPQAEVAVVPPPVRAPFYDPPPREEARLSFGVPLGESCVLLVSGGWGLGPMAASARALAAAGHFVLAASGENRRLRAELDRIAGTEPRVVSLGYCRDMPRAMAAADVVVSGSGQTCNEVHAVGRRLVVLDVVPGHGRENLLHEVATTSAVAASPIPSSVVAAVETSLKSDRPGRRWPVSSPTEWEDCLLRALAPLGLDT